jgi:hypothetical protein
VIRRQFPARPIGGDIEVVPKPQVAPNGYAAKSTFETDDMILLHRAPDRHRRLRGLLRRWDGSETRQCAMHADQLAAGGVLNG